MEIAVVQRREKDLAGRRDEMARAVKAGVNTWPFGIFPLVGVRISSPFRSECQKNDHLGSFDIGVATERELAIVPVVREESSEK